jgi:hypothetical protein
MMRIVTVVSALWLTIPQPATSQPLTSYITTEPYVGCYSLTGLFTIIHAWRYYGRDMASSAWHFQTREGDCLAEMRLSVHLQGTAISQPMLLTNQSGWASSAVVREIEMAGRTIFYIDGRW